MPQVRAQLLKRRQLKKIIIKIFIWFDKYTRQRATKSNLPKCRNNSSIEVEGYESEELDGPYDGKISDEELPVESDSSKTGAKTCLSDMKLVKNKVKKDKRMHNNDK